jgi:hypothetical protein
VDFSLSPFCLAAALAAAAASLTARFASINACSASRLCCSKESLVHGEGLAQVGPGQRWGLVFVRQKHADGRSRVVNVHRASGGNQLGEAGRVRVRVAHVECEGQSAGAGLGADDREAKEPSDIPETAGFVLPGNTGRDCNALLVNSASDKDRKADSRFLGGFADFDLEAVGDGLRAGVLVNDRPKVRAEPSR